MMMLDEVVDFIEEEDTKVTLEWLEKFLIGETVQERATTFCGGRHISYTPESGLSIGIHRCQQHRTCQFCFDIRKGEFQARLTHKENPDDMIAIVCDAEMAKKLTRSRKVSGDDYLRSPLEGDDGKVIIAISKSIADSVKSFKYEHWTAVVDESGNIDPIILDSFANLPEGKRISGSLGKIAKKEKKEVEYPEPEDENDVLELPVPRFLGDTANDNLISSLFIKAIMETSDVQPTEKQQLLDVHDERIRRFSQLMSQNGIENMIVRWCTKTVSLKWALKSFITIKEIKPDVQIILNTNIESIITPMAKSFRDALSHEIGAERVKNIPIA